MTDENKTKLTLLKKNFTAIWKTVQPYVKYRPLTRDLNLIEGYRTDIVNTYNELLNYISEIYSNESPGKQKKLDETVRSNFSKIQIAFEVLQLKYTFPENIFAQIDTNSIEYLTINYGTADDRTQTESDISDNNESITHDIPYKLSDLQTNEPSTSSQRNETNQEETNNSNSDSEDSFTNSFIGDTSIFEDPIEHIVDENIATMVQSATDFFRLASSIINYKYNGEPGKRDGFITDAELVEELAAAENKATAFKFIKSRLEGKALEALRDGDDTVEKINDSLKAYIKDEASTVIEGRMLALRLDKGNFTKFAKAAEEQAELLRRSLINEGIGKSKATELSIRKTKDLCRKLARSEIVKSVFTSATQFETPSEVIAAFITENDIARKEKHDSEVYKNNKQNNNKQSGNKKFFNKNGNRNGNNSNNGNNRGGNNGNYSNRNGNNRGNGNNNNRNNNGGNWRNNRGGGNSNNRSNEHTIRLVQGNQPGPSAGGNSQTNQAETVFHLPIA